MNFFATTISFSSVFFGSLALAIGAIGLWWLIRKRVNRIWLPTVKILNLPKKSLPKMTAVIPPLVPFLCFLFSALSLLFLTLQPKESVQIDAKRNRQNHHIYIDLSPSHSTVRNIQQLKTEVEALYKLAADDVSLSISDSRNGNFFELTDQADLDNYLSSINFHRAGVKIGQSIRSRFEALSNVDRLYIFSDMDFHSWADFQWQFLSDKIDIYRMNPTRNSELANVFINKVVNISDRSEESSVWEVEIARVGATSLKQGELSVTANEKTIASDSWSFPQSENQIKVRLQWNRELTTKSGVEELVFQISSQDALLDDNIFRAKPSKESKRVLIIADQGGELQLEDPAYHLIRTLEVVGMQVDRVDNAKGLTAADFEQYSQIILAGGTGNGLEDYCPAKAINPSDKPNDKKVWIFPISANADYREMCFCLVSLKNSDIRSEPDYCSESSGRTSWAMLLKSTGAKGVGGSIGREQSAAAWIYSNETAKNEILAFSISLNPRLPGGPSFSQFPVFIRSLLEWQNLTPADLSLAKDWPRVEDITKSSRKVANISNVPFGESNLKSLTAEDLPPVWQDTPSGQFKQALVKKQSETPEPWLIALLFTIIGLVTLETIFSLFSSLRANKKQNLFKALGILFVCSLVSQNAEAQITVNALGYGGQETSSHLSFEISSRTSIEMERFVIHQKSLGKSSLKSPWLWSRNLSPLLDKNGRFNQDLVHWIKNGGFLIVEDTSDASILDTAIKKHFTHHAFTPEWKPIPPDHEIMRSFYLLDSLPQCNGAPWRGFVFDQRLAILVVPFRFFESLADNATRQTCATKLSREQMVRTFVNILMVALATDYKKDQIHLPEILKRLR